MQTLWSRVAQAQSTCRCRVCLPSTNAIVRRSATAASRRKVTASDLFTACYTTILGTAAVIDSRRKDARRKELDERLEKARASLSSLAVQETPVLLEEQIYQAPTDSTRRRTEHDGSSIRSGTTDLSAFLDELAQLATATLLPRSGPALPQHQVDWTLVEAAISAEERDPELHLRHPRDQSQLERTTRTVESLVQTLLWRARNPETATQYATHTFQGDQCLEEAEELMSDYPSYSSPHIEPEAASDARVYLSETFRNIFNRAADAKEVVGKICYNLLLSSTPPNIHNYNTLIAGFSRINRPDLAQAVIESFLDKTAWPATQQTLVCLLEHARTTNDIDLFRETIGRMRGTIQDGVHLRIMHRDAIYDEVGQQWAQKYAVGRKFAYVERAHRSPEVFNSMIKGWLQFGRVDVASMSFVACVRNQLLVPVDTIHELLTQCLATLNKKTARTMLDRLGKDFEQFEKLMDHIVAESTAQMAKQIGDLFSALFSLCGFIYNPVISDRRREIRQLLNLFQKHVTGSDEKAENRIDNIACIAALAKECQSQEEKTRRIEAHVKVLILQHKTGYDLNASNHLPPIDWQNRTRHEHYPSLSYALQAVNHSLDMTTEHCIKMQLLSRLPNQAVAKRLKTTANLENLSIQSLISFYHPHQERSGKPGAVSQDAVGWLTAQASEIEQNLQAILFSELSKARQRSYRALCPDWYSMPTEKLCEHISQALIHRARGQRSRNMQQHAVAQHHDNELDEVEDRTLSTSNQALPWERGNPTPHGYVDMPLPVVKPTTTVLPAPRRRIWSEECLDMTRYQQAEVAC